MIARLLRRLRTAILRSGRCARDLSITPCSVRGCQSPSSSETWFHGVCADMHTHGQQATVCTECDIALNAHHLRTFFGHDRDRDLAYYAAHKRGGNARFHALIEREARRPESCTPEFYETIIAAVDDEAFARLVAPEEREAS